MTNVLRAIFQRILACPATASILLLLLPLGFPAIAHAQLKEYDTRYYTIYTDIDPDEEKEAAIRMTKMAEEYHERTKSFAGQIRSKFPFYLFRSAADYYKAGGIPGSAGVFMYDGTQSRLMAIAGKKTSLDTWHVVQHEGFHQFAHAVIGGEMPVWLNEGLAEYFGESIFTGDGFVTGIIPPWRLSRLKTEIADDKIKHLTEMMHLSSEQWREQLNIQNYDQAWSMVHFLVQGDDQKYQSRFADCLRAISNGSSFDHAWMNTLGSPDGFEERWKQWWIDQPTSPTATLYGRAAVATMTSFVARAFAQKQTFADFNAFHTAVDADELKINPDDWLPNSLITNAFRLYGSAPTWILHMGLNKQPTVGLTLIDGTRITGTFVLRGNKVDRVNVDIDDMAVVLKKAQGLLDDKHKDQARALVQKAVRQNPNSASAGDAAKFLKALRDGPA